jgi:hypothetical protein
MIIQGILLILDAWILWGIIYLAIGIFLFIDDLIAETMGKSVMERLPDNLKEENTLKLIGVIIFIVESVWFVYLFFFI